MNELERQQQGAGDLEAGGPEGLEPEGDLARWQEQWREESVPPSFDVARLRRRSRLRTIGLVAYLGFSALVGAVGCGLLFAVALGSGHPIDWAVALGLVALVVWALHFEVRSLSGLWRPAEETPAAFLDLAVERCRRWLRVVRFAWAFLALEVLLLIPWILLRLGERAATRPLTQADWLGAFGLLGGLVTLMFLALLLARRWALRRLEALTALRASWEE
ncbi:MAG TPA: hypothetical protein VF017_10100 [Thermoanaerobaculia bacterium]|nr:hypothetical protein [Thermoanaerobaculia bacterium]